MNATREFSKSALGQSRDDNAKPAMSIYKAAMKSIELNGLTEELINERLQDLNEHGENYDLEDVKYNIEWDLQFAIGKGIEDYTKNTTDLKNFNLSKNPDVYLKAEDCLRHVQNYLEKCSPETLESTANKQNYFTDAAAKMRDSNFIKDAMQVFEANNGLSSNSAPAQEITQKH